MSTKLSGRKIYSECDRAAFRMVAAELWSPLDIRWCFDSAKGDRCFGRRENWSATVILVSLFQFLFSILTNEVICPKLK